MINWLIKRREAGTDKELEFSSSYLFYFGAFLYLLAGVFLVATNFIEMVILGALFVNLATWWFIHYKYSKLVFEIRKVGMSVSIRETDTSKTKKKGSL